MRFDSGGVWLLNERFISNEHLQESEAPGEWNSMEDFESKYGQGSMAIEELMKLEGGVDEDMVDVYFSMNSEMMMSLFSALADGNILNQGGRVYIKPSIFFELTLKGVAF